MIDKILDLIMAETTYTDRDHMRTVVEGHIKYHTCACVMDGEICAGFFRWNIMPQETVAFACDTVIHPDYRDGKVWLMLVDQAMKMWPKVEEVLFERGYDDGTKIKVWHKFKTKDIQRRIKNAIHIIEKERLVASSCSV